MGGGTTHVRLTPEAASVANGLAGDSILVLAGLGPLNRSQVVTLACHLLSLVANDLAETGEDGDPRMVTDVVPVGVLDLLYNRWLAHQDARDTGDANRVRLGKLNEAMKHIAQVSTGALSE